MTVDVVVTSNGDIVHTDWALNEAAVQKAAPERMLEVVAGDRRAAGHRVRLRRDRAGHADRFDGVRLLGGRAVVWPEVEALLMVPISAHALFAKPLVTSPDSCSRSRCSRQDPAGDGVLWCDGRRTVELPPGARVEVRRGAVPVRLARLHHASFTDRLVAKFALPVPGGGAPPGATAGDLGHRRGSRARHDRTRAWPSTAVQEDPTPDGKLMRSGEAAGQTRGCGAVGRLVHTAGGDGRRGNRARSLGRPHAARDPDAPEPRCHRRRRAGAELAGLNVVTGETGAGKTMVVSGLGLLLGALAPTPGLVRTGARSAVVEGSVDVEETHPCGRSAPRRRVATWRTG